MHLSVRTNACGSIYGRKPEGGQRVRVVTDITEYLRFRPAHILDGRQKQTKHQQTITSANMKSSTSSTLAH